MLVVDLMRDRGDRCFAPCQRMAAAIIDITARRGACRPHDLLAAGFTRKETAERWPVARALAAIARLMDVS